MNGMWFKAQMAAHGLNQEKVAAKLGIDRSVVSKILNGKVNLEARHAPLLAELFKSTPEEILQHAGVLPPQSGQNPALNAPHNPDDNPDYPPSNVRGQPEEKARDIEWQRREMVKVMGTGQGGDGSGFFEWNGEIIDHVKRPPKLAGRQRVFAIYISGESMYPAYRDGALIYIDENLRPRVGRDALIELRSTQDGEVPRALVKRVVTIGADAIKVEQFNPPKSFTIKKADIRHAYLVLEMEDLF